MRPPSQYVAYPPPNILNTPGMAAAASPISRYPYKPVTTHITPPIITAVSTANMSTSTAPPPITSNPNATIYVGNLAPFITNDILKNLLEHCGKVVRLNRAEPTPQKPAGFGFVDFENPGGAHRALTMLNNASIAEKTIIINCQDKVREAIAGWRTQYIYQLTKTAVGKTTLSAEIEFNEEEARLKRTIENAVRELNENYKIYLEEKSQAEEEAPPEKKSPEVKRSTSTSSSAPKNKESTPEKNEQRHTHGDSSSDSSSSIIPKERVNYLSKDYRPHWREIDREKEIKQREKDIEKTYQKREKEWEKDEDALHTKITQKLQFTQINIPKETLDKLVSNDLKGKLPSSMTSSRSWSDWKKQREFERKLDEKDVQDELEEQKLEEEENKKKSERDRLLAEKEAQIKLEEAERIKAETLAKMSQAEVFVKSALDANLDSKLFQPIRISQSNLTLSAAFGGPLEDDGDLFNPKHKPLTKLVEHRDITNQAQHAEERIKVIEDSKRILSIVPSEKEEIFSYPLKWDLIKKEDVIESKLRPWVKKKVIEYMGAGEDLVQDVIDYVIGQVKEEPDPYTLLEDLERFLDVEGEGFLKSMWRMLIFVQLKIENEAK